MIVAGLTRDHFPNWLHAQHGDKLMQHADVAYFQSAEDPGAVWIFTPPDLPGTLDAARAAVGGMT